VDPELARCAAAVAAACRDGAADQLLFCFAKARRVLRGGRSSESRAGPIPGKIELEVVGCDGCIVREEGRARDDVVQLAHVAGPGMSFQERDRVVREDGFASIVLDSE
jgi:hypothetical protein